MKKLMTTMLAVAAGVGLHAVGMADTGTSFEGLTGGAPYNIYEVDAAVGNGGELTPLTEGQTYWVTNGTETLTVVGDTSVGVNAGRPTQYWSKDQYKYLSIKTTLGNPVTRYVSTNHQESVNINTGYYFDSLVKFTAFDEDQSIELNGGKLAIWLKEVYGNGDNADPTGTNLVITAGYLDSNLQQKAYTTNYVCTVDVDLNDGAWHRVTVKAIDSIYKAGIAPVPGFVVFIDKKRVVCGDDKGIINKSSLTDNAYILDSEDALFPSADQSSGSKLAIAAVQFDGQGDVDDLVFTSTVPFDEAKDAEFFAINLGEHVTGVQGLINGEDLFTISAATSIVYAADQSVQIITNNVTCETGWMFGSVTNEAGAAVAVESAYTTTAGGSITVTAKPLGAYVDDTPYETLADAVAAANAAGSSCTVKLAADAAAGITINNANSGVTITLDLAGNNITATAGDTAAIRVLANAALTITNSTVTVGTVQGLVNNNQVGPAVYGLGTVAIQAGVYNGQVFLAGAQSSISGGSFLATYGDGETPQTVNTAANLNAKIVEGYEATLADNYYTLTEVVTYTVTFNLNGGSVLAPIEAQTVSANGHATAPSETPVKDHYTFQFWSADGTTAFDFANTAITGNIELTAVYAAVTYTVTFNTNGGDVMPAIPDQSVAYNGYATDPNVTPVKEHYLFKWWSADASSEFVFASTPIVANTQLTAVYTAAVYTVTFMVDGSLYDTETAEYNTTLAVLPENPTKAECVFTGWSTNSTAEGVVDLQSFLITGTTELNAIWTVLPPAAIDPEDGTIAVTIEAESADAAIATVLVNPPTGSGADAAAYKALFDFEATSAEGGKYTVTLTGIKDTVVTAVDTSAVALLTSSASTGTITIPAGLYYRITPSTALPISGTAVSGLSTGASETVTKPGPTQGFYKVELSAVPFAVPNS